MAAGGSQLSWAVRWLLLARVGSRGWSWDADGSVWKAARDSCLDVTPTMLSWIWGVLFCSLVRAAKAQLCGWPGLTFLLVDIR